MEFSRVLDNIKNPLLSNLVEVGLDVAVDKCVRIKG